MEQQLCRQLLSDCSFETAPRDERLDEYQKLRRCGDAGDSQQKRRRQLLEKQQRNRDAQLSKFRQLLENDDEGNEEDMEVVPKAFRYKQTAKTPHQGEENGVMQRGSGAGPRRRRRYQHVLMFSEWMLERPEHFSEQWLLKLCPHGKRCLVLTTRCRYTRKRCTIAFSAGGHRIRQFTSLLPGGAGGGSRRSTMLDCVFDPATDTFHVLDVICWNGHWLDNCEAEFRFAWLASKLCEDCVGIDTTDTRNTCRFVVTPALSCRTSVSLTDALSHPAVDSVDGLLMYHRHGHYTSGQCPLVLWIKPFMTTECWNLPADIVLPSPPVGYVDMRQYIAQYERQRRSCPPRRHNDNDEHTQSDMVE